MWDAAVVVVDAVVGCSGEMKDSSGHLTCLSPSRHSNNDENTNCLN